MSLIKRFTTRNVGGVDRVLRAVPAFVTLALWLTGTLGGVPLIVAAIMSAMLLLTSITGLCSVYALLGVSTVRTD